MLIDMDLEFSDVLDANRAYAANFGLGGLAAPAAKGLGVLTCIDSRIEPLAMLGLAPGDAKIFRNAGARATDDALRSLVLAVGFLGVRRIMVVAHTDCALAGVTNDELRDQLGARLPEAGVAGFDFLAMPDQHATLVADVNTIRHHPLLPEGLPVCGFLYDVDTGIIHPA